MYPVFQVQWSSVRILVGVGGVVEIFHQCPFGDTDHRLDRHICIFFLVTLRADSIVDSSSAEPPKGPMFETAGLIVSFRYLDSV